MKRSFLFLMASAIMAATFVACEPKNKPVEDTRNWSEDGGLRAADNLLFGDTIGNGDDEFVFTGIQTLKKGKYLLRGWVYIADGAVLTIEPGTIILGDKDTKAALIVERGGKLYAEGTAQEPIVFTSEMPKGQRRPGDWGGLIICGRAENNQTEQQIEGGPRSKHGGNDNADCSGALSYVRVEFAGYPFQTDKEINGITLGSVGSNTKVDHVQVSYSNDDSFEWFGGAVNCNHLIAFHGWDDDFDTDNGFSGHVQYGLSIRNSRLADVSQSNGFESDNCADGASVAPYTTCVFSNMTFIGPKADPSFKNEADYINGGEYFPNNGSSLGRFQSGMQIRRNSHLCCFNSIFAGWPIGMMVDNEKGNCWQAANDGLIQVQNTWIIDADILGSDMNKQYVDQLAIDYKEKTFDSEKPSFSSTFFLSQSGNHQATAEEAAYNYVGLSTNNGVGALLLASGSPLLNAASFSASVLRDFEPVSYVGAFDAANDWTKGWANFDPQNTDY